MKTAILTVGTEILFGQIVNTNAVYLSRQLNSLGHDVMYHYTVGDNAERLGELIEFAFHDCDMIITTGGLGPTEDDLTKEVACETLHDSLVLNEEELRKLEDRMGKLGREMTPNNIKQAYLPSRARVLKNPQGTAPGFALEENGKIIICMPGPPREMNYMFEHEVKPYLEEKSDGVIYYKLVHTYGIGESSLETALLDLIDTQTDPTIATYAKEGESQVRVASRRATIEEAQAAVEDMIGKIRDRIGKYIYSEDDESMAEVVGRKLMERGITISSAESCTGGLFANALIEVPGISAVFDRGLVTYSNRAKVEELGVSEETLDRFGAVSEQTAAEMAEGLAEVTGSDICVSVTGIAGPDGGTKEKPVGLVYTALTFKGKTVVKENRFVDNGRKWIRDRSVLTMLRMVYDVLGDSI
ncbi:MAG: competence/damage-inducible protein A [Anaerovoracaceae bacterium]|jgi:nicotinamide-nucleotide amidase